ncbi:hypothetical protein, partial [uncultured Gemmiger sp.]|uniref:hypothetical protein n=1 Tax=uncultured Gemmiger sp. TaxID=1623490 RepID=UPI0025FF7377
MEKRKTRRNVLWESADIDDLISKKGTAGLFIRWCLFDYKDRKENKGNTAQFPPCGLSTAPAAAARHLRC